MVKACGRTSGGRPAAASTGTAPWSLDDSSLSSARTFVYAGLTPRTPLRASSVTPPSLWVKFLLFPRPPWSEPLPSRETSARLCCSVRAVVCIHRYLCLTLCPRIVSAVAVCALTAEVTVELPKVGGEWNYPCMGDSPRLEVEGCIGLYTVHSWLLFESPEAQAALPLSGVPVHAPNSSARVRKKPPNALAGACKRVSSEWTWVAGIDHPVRSPGRGPSFPPPGTGPRWGVANPSWSPGHWARRGLGAGRERACLPRPSWGRAAAVAEERPRHRTSAGIPYRRSGLSRAQRRWWPGPPRQSTEKPSLKHMHRL